VPRITRVLFASGPDEHESSTRIRVGSAEGRGQAGRIAAEAFNIQHAGRREFRASTSLRYAEACRNLQCSRPRGPDGKFSRDGYCAACEKWRRRHNGEDRPIRLILAQQERLGYEPGYWSRGT